MKTQNSSNKYLILDVSKRYIIILLLVMGVFLFPKTAYLNTIDSEKIIELTNIERAYNNLAPLTANQYLTKAAYNKALDIFKYQKFEHNFNNKRFSSWIREVDYQYKYVGENLAIDFVTSEGVIAGWKASPSHYENITREDYKEIGVAVIRDTFNNKNSILVVQIFGTPKNNFINLDINKEIILEQERLEKDSLSGISYLTHSNQKELKLFAENEMFLENSFEKITLDSKEENKSNIPDLFFTLVGFIYLGIFKLVSIKNIGL